MKSLQKYIYQILSFIVIYNVFVLNAFAYVIVSTGTNNNSMLPAKFQSREALSVSASTDFISEAATQLEITAASYGMEMKQATAPKVISVSFSTDFITETTTQFEITVTYDMEMKQSPIPEVTFEGSVEIQNTLSVPSGSWNSSVTEYKVVYNVDRTTNEQSKSVSIIIANAQSSAGAVQEEYRRTGAFSVDLLEIIPTLGINSPYTLDCRNDLFVIPIEFNQKMVIPENTNIVSFSPDATSAGFLEYSRSEWDDATRRLSVYYNVNGSIAASIDDIDIRIGEVTNDYGKVFSGKSWPGVFSIKSSPPDMQITNYKAPSCYGFNDGEITISVTGGLPAYTYNWFKDGTLYSNANQLASAEAGHYRIRVSGTDGCFAQKELELESAHVMALTATVLRHVETIEDGKIALKVEGGTEPYSYYMNNISYGDKTIIENLPAGTYNCKVEDANNCLAEAGVEIKNYSAPTAFTPNDDGHNDIFMPGYPAKIFDRNGTLIYQGENGWDGKYKGHSVRPAVYFYIVTFPDGYERKGTVQIFK
jgi:gliding motility-associated-like protein